MNLQILDRDTSITNQDHILIHQSKDFEACKTKQKVSNELVIYRKAAIRTGPVKMML